jgi:hypothetical protein
MVKELICMEGAVGNKLSPVCSAVIPGKGGSHGSVTGGICHEVSEVRGLDGTFGNRAHQLGSRWLTEGWVLFGLLSMSTPFAKKQCLDPQKAGAGRPALNVNYDVSCTLF